MKEPRRHDDHWLTRPATIRWLWIGFAVILALTVAAQLLIPMEGTFGTEKSFGFAAWFGFISCVAMVLVARVLGWLLKRGEDYYGETDPEERNDD